MPDVRIYGPYTRKDGRQIVIINGTTVSYPRYLYEQHHKIKLHSEDTIDHIDGDPSNNSIDNLRVLSRSMNASLNHKSAGRPFGYKQTEEQKRSGAKNGKAKLTQEQVNFYRKAYEEKRMIKDSIIRETGLDRKTVENFLKYRSYK